MRGRVPSFNRSILAPIVSTLLCGPSSANVIVNEVLANEPSGHVTLEWIEIYNSSSVTVSLSGYRLSAGSDWIDLPVAVSLSPDEYYIMCRKLFSTESPGFESVWGDSSGVWGDTPEESSLQAPLEASFSLRNGSGIVVLYDPLDAPVSELYWNEAGDDGFSWERLDPTSSEVAQSVDPAGSTPGFVNSCMPLLQDLSLVIADVLPQDGNVVIHYAVRNAGLEPVTGAVLSFYLDSSTTPTPPDTIEVIALGPLTPGDSLIGDRQFRFDGVYIRLGASLSADDRIRNNHREFVATGVDFPPLVLSEVLANPQEPLATEWVEIKNRLSQTVSLTGWRLGDSLSLYPLVETPVVVPPLEYVVIAQDTIAFLNHYRQFQGILIQSERWATLNNGSDVVWLVDSFGFAADRFKYAAALENDFTWSRGEETGREDDWGRSEFSGGTPGEPNSVLFEPDSFGLGLVVLIEPTVFSPDGDGIDDVTTITIEQAPAEAELTLKIYDRDGRIVRTLVDRQRFLQSSYEWDGRADGGRRLPIGIYILYVSASTGESAKRTVVIAR
ncbi:MAG TPA: lamin tail domain-containing protein [Candidatus Deferrimicrobium sp.]|nr:lamin tail domain-containing protein [Candidatus Deferrimicrobium sp.]